MTLNSIHPDPLTEFKEIIIGSNQSRPVMSRPPAFQATKKFIREVQDELGLPDDQAQDAADWVLNKMERYAAQFARPVFDMEGSGPQCSMCSMIWPLCGHQHMSAELGDDEEDEDDS